MADLVFFSESRIQLQKEVRNHPKLCELIADHPVTEFEEIIAEIAAYCNVIMDGAYYPEDLDKLCDILYWKLRNSRSPLILSS